MPPSTIVVPAQPNISVGDKVVLLFSDDLRRRSVRLVEGKSDLEKGHLSVSSPLGKAVLGAEEGEEIEFRLDDGRQRKALIESVVKSFASAATSEPTGGDVTTSALTLNADADPTQPYVR